MSVELDRHLRGRGTKFRLYPQSPVIERFSRPETVWVSPLAGSVTAGPSDDRMYVIDAIDKKYYDFDSEPPYEGPRHDPAQPDADGHFDAIGENDIAFRSAHIYGSVRRTLDIWEDYLGEAVPWHFESMKNKMELVPWVDWNNAHLGWGFLEAGWGKDDKGEKRPFCLNFDVLAHEVGHALVFSVVGFPYELEALTSEYRGFHESASDLVALLSVLHFQSFMEDLLDRTHGNLYVENELNRIGELSGTRQIRIASNALKMSQVPDVGRKDTELTGKELHLLGEPLTGAFFDIMMAVYQDKLVEYGAISADLAHRSSRVVDENLGDGDLKKDFAAAYKVSPFAFRDALAEARDYLGYRLALAWRITSPEKLNYGEVAKSFLTVDRWLSGSKYQRDIIDCFHWREIAYGHRVKGIMEPMAKTEGH